MQVQIFKLLMIGFLISGCSTSSTALYGHWIERGSSTFTNRFQCVETFAPFKNKEC